MVTGVVIDNGGTGYTRAPVITFTGGGGTGATAVPIGWHVMQPKAIQELFETAVRADERHARLRAAVHQRHHPDDHPARLRRADDRGSSRRPTSARPIGTLGDGTQIWKITHNGVDTHTIHFHLFNVQVINRVGWDGAIRPPDANELGWKESVRMNPLEDAIVALRPTLPVLPFKIPDSQRPIDVTRPTTASITTFDPITGNAVNVPNDVDRLRVGVRVALPPARPRRERHDAADQVPRVAGCSDGPGRHAPAIPGPCQQPGLPAGQAGLDACLRDLPDDDELRRPAGDGRAFTQNVTMFGLQPTPQTAPSIPASTTTFTDTTVANGTQYWYEVRAENNVGYSAWSGSDNVTTADGLNVTASSATITYGSPVPSITPAFSPIIPPGAALTTAPVCTTTYTQGAPVGTYPTTCIGPSFQDPAYLFITYFPGTVTVTPAPLTITAPSGTYPYGGPVPAFAPTYATFVGTDTPASLTGTVTCTPTFTTTTAAGTYPTSCSGATSTNYTITYVAGSVTVTPLALTITASSVINPPMVYGGPVPLITPIYAGLAPADTAPATPPTCSTTATITSPAGTYASSCTGAADPNYNPITYVPGVVHVTQAALGIFAPTGTMVYGGAVPPITYSGFVPPDTAASLTSLPTCTWTPTPAAPAAVGTYLTACGGAASPNYVFLYMPGIVTVTKAAATTVVTSSVNPSVHGQSVTFTATVTRSSAGTGAVPTGTVQFKVDGVNLGGARTLNAAGVATIATTTLTTATHSVVATYSGDANYLGGTSAALSQRVNKAGTTTTLTLTTPVSRQTTIRYTARVRAVAPGAGTPTGTVRFYRGNTLIGSATLSGGVAVLNYRNTNLATGTYSMHATYVASTNFLTSTSPNVRQRITP